jgi:hypothetical protein
MKKKSYGKRNVGEGMGAESALPVIGERPKWAR